MLSEHKGELAFIGFAMVAYLVMASLDVSQNYVYLAAIFGLFGLIIAWKLYEGVDDESAGNEKMTEIAEAIHEGAMVFLSREYKILGYFMGGIFLLGIMVGHLEMIMLIFKKMKILYQMGIMLVGLKLMNG